MAEQQEVQFEELDTSDVDRWVGVRSVGEQRGIRSR